MLFLLIYTNDIFIDNSTTSYWLLESGSSYHLTYNVSTFSNFVPYTGREIIIVGNGSNLPIQSVRSSSVLVVNNVLDLCQILHTPKV